MRTGTDNQAKAVESGHWLLYRWNPKRAVEGKNPLQLDSREPSIPITDYMYAEARFKMLTKADPARAKMLAERAQQSADERWKRYSYLAAK